MPSSYPTIKAQDLFNHGLLLFVSEVSIISILLKAKHDVLIHE